MPYSKIQSFMKKDIIIGLLLVSNLISGFYLVKQTSKVQRIEQLTSISDQNVSEEKDSVSSNDILKQIKTTNWKIVNLRADILLQNYENYKKNQPSVLEDLDFLISLTENEQDIKSLLTVRKIIMTRPKYEEIDKAWKVYFNYLNKCEKNKKKQEESNFYNNK